MNWDGLIHSITGSAPQLHGGNNIIMMKNNHAQGFTKVVDFNINILCIIYYKTYVYYITK